MGRRAKAYIYSVIAAGGMVLAASLVKLRPPGMDGTCALSQDSICCSSA